MNKLNNPKIAVIALGYVRLPLAVEFGKKYPIVGFDINKNTMNELQSTHDHTLEVDKTDLEEVIHLT